MTLEEVKWFSIGVVSMGILVLFLLEAHWRRNDH